MRQRILSLADYLGIGVAAGGIGAAIYLFAAKLRAGTTIRWWIPASIVAVVILATLIRWFTSRQSEAAAARLADEVFGLEDRLATAHGIVSENRELRPVEQALVADSADRLTPLEPARVVPARLNRWHGLGLTGVTVLIVALLWPARVLPLTPEVIAEREELLIAGEYLEESAKETIKDLQPENDTAHLAKEQEELGRAIKKAEGSRAEFLRKLGSLEGRIQERYEKLKETKADEIVSLAEQRLSGAARTEPGSIRRSNSSTDEKVSEQIEPSDPKTASSPRLNSGASNNLPSDKSEKIAQEKSPNQGEPGGIDKPQIQDERNADNKSAPSATSEASRKPGERASSRPGQDESPRINEPPGAKQDQPQSSETPDEKSAQTPQEPGKTDPLTGMLAEQAVKTSPALSGQLLEKAAQMRAGQLSPEDIKRLAKAAEGLADDLAKMAESREFQQTVEQLAKQVNPEQLEQVAQELMKNEKLVKELQASARLLMENREVRNMMAGMAEKFAGLREREERGREGRGEGAQRGQGTDGSPTDKQISRTTEKGRVTSTPAENAKTDKKTPVKRGEYLYLKAKSEEGAARVTYSTAYPTYRREAERAIRRSQVPPHLRSMVKTYFDSINPDATTGKSQEK